MNMTQADQARWDKVWQFLRGLGCKHQLGTDNAEMAVDFIRELQNPKRQQHPRTEQAEASSLSDLLSALDGLVEKWGKEAEFLNNPDDHPEDRASGRAYRDCAEALRKIASST